MKQILISSCVPDGGIFCYTMQPNKTLRMQQKLPADRPMYTILSEGELYVLERQPNIQDPNSALCFYLWQKDSFTEVGPCLSTKGVVAPHLCLLDGNVYAVNYLSGSVIKFPNTVVYHQGKGRDPIRQDAPHPHSITPTPDGNLLVADLGTDHLYVYDKDLHLKSKSSVSPGNGPRHTVFSSEGNRFFCVNELSSTVSMYSYENNHIEKIDETEILPENYNGKNLAAAIRFYKGKIYASNRGHDSVACLKVVNNTLQLERMIPCGGRGPRDFDIFGDVMICTNENSNSVTVLDLPSGELLSSIDLPRPICVTFAET